MVKVAPDFSPIFYRMIAVILTYATFGAIRPKFHYDCTTITDCRYSQCMRFKAGFTDYIRKPSY
jgi:hypothetical protein